MRHTSRDKVRSHRMDVGSQGRSQENARQSISHQVKEQGGDGAALPQATTIRKEPRRLTINQHRSVTSTNQLEDTMHISTIKSTSQQNLTQEGPTHEVIRFLEV